MKKIKRQPSEWEKMFANEITCKWLISKTYKQLMQLNNKETTQRKNGQMISVYISPKKASVQFSR